MSVEVHSKEYEKKRSRWKHRAAGVDKETEKSVLDVLWNGPYYTGGEQSESLEKEFAEHFKTKYAISCGSGTAAVHLIYMGYEIGDGDEVIMPANNFMSNITALVRERGRPVLVDIEEETYNIDPDKVVEAITPKTKAIVLDHMCGHPDNMDIFMELGQEHNIKIIGDAARALGARYKGKPIESIADATLASIGSKCIASAGQAGMVFTNDKDLAHKMYMMRGYGKDAWGYMKDKLGAGQDYKYFGLNYEIGEINAAVARHELRKLEGWNEKRRANAKLINEILEGITAIQLPVVKSWATSVYNWYLVKVLEKSDELQQYLKQKGMRVKFSGPGHYPYVHLQKIVQEKFGYKEGDFPVLESQFGKLADLTNIHWTKTEEEVTQVPKLIKDFYS